MPPCRTGGRSAAPCTRSRDDFPALGQGPALVLGAQPQLRQGSLSAGGGLAAGVVIAVGAPIPAVAVHPGYAAQVRPGGVVVASPECPHHATSSERIAEPATRRMMVRWLAQLGESR